MPTLDQQTIHRVTKRGVSEIIVEKEFIQRLQEGKPLRLKMGFDPNRPDIHLGHVVGLRKLRQLQELGHQLILIVGDWTAQIGDPSGRSETRNMLSREQVLENAESYMRQFFKVVDKDKTQAVYQSEWFGKFGLEDVIRLTALFTVNQFLHRDDFAKRYEAQQPIAVTELMYPLMQAYDSVAIKSDVEFGGTDQKFNLLVGRDLQEKMGMRPQQCFMMPLLPGTDGVRKMSKSFDNYIGVEEPANQMFGKVMSLPDHLITTYFELLTDVSEGDIEEMRQALAGKSVNPMDLKKKLGHEIVTEFHSAPAAREARAEFERVVQRGEAPSDVPELAVTPLTEGVQSIDSGGVTIELSRFAVGAKLAASRADAKRILAQGGVEIDSERELREVVTIPFGAVLRYGRRRFVRIVKA